MRYPTISQSAVKDLGQLRQQGYPVDVDTRTIWAGSGDEVNIDHLQALGEDFGRRALADPPDKDRLEGELARPLWRAVRDLPVEALDAPGFWAYLSIAYFWNFIAWRERGAFDTLDEKESWLTYVDGRLSTESVLPRMYLRLEAIGGETFDSLADAVPKSTDFWRSHIIRVRTGTAPPLTRALVRSQRDDRLKTGPLRVLARDFLNRTWTNVLMSIYDDDEAEEIIADLRAAIPDIGNDGDE